MLKVSIHIFPYNSNMLSLYRRTSKHDNYETMVPRRYLPIVITNNILKEQKYVRTIHLKYRIKKYVNNILNNLKHENDTSVWYVPNVAS